MVCLRVCSPYKADSPKLAIRMTSNRNGVASDLIGSFCQQVHLERYQRRLNLMAELK
jgi:hypothetical protein